ncbi:hypothetical protein C5167_006313 [Papaver somniferum]|uniref:Uncharacterized protein n=1 Tax=Papaver somniferum TaxID=3469 RepID=A0A4Y7JG58_PAPSO|nr:hypothetical protein C5167_006313 [Papaver somniferum]
MFDLPSKDFINEGLGLDCDGQWYMLVKMLEWIAVDELPALFNKKALFSLKKALGVPENVISSPVPSSTPLFTFGAPTNSSSDDLSASTTSLFCAPTTVASEASNGLNTSLDTTSATTIVAANGITNPSNVASTNSSISTLPATPAVPFQFG